MSNVLGAKDPNVAVGAPIADPTAKPDIKSMEYHRQVLANKIEQGQDAKYVSPSDNIMSPCTAKLSAFRSKQFENKAKPKSLFAKASSKKLEGEALFGSKPSAP